MTTLLLALIAGLLMVLATRELKPASAGQGFATIAKKNALAFGLALVWSVVFFAITLLISLFL